MHNRRIKLIYICIYKAHLQSVHTIAPLRLIFNSFIRRISFVKLQMQKEAAGTRPRLTRE